jgi:hypothetical protein
MTQQSSQPADPIIGMIEAYTEGRKSFLALNPPPGPQDEDRLWHEMAFQHYSAIVHETPPITSMEGVRAVLRFIKNNEDRDFEDDVPPKLVLAIANFMEDDERKATEPDPVHAAITSFIEAKAVLSQPGLTEEEMKRAFRLYEQQGVALGEFRPTTPEGERRLLEVLFVDDVDNLLEERLPFFRALMGYANRHLGLDLEWPEDFMIDVSLSLDVRHGQAAS